MSQPYPQQPQQPQMHYHTQLVVPAKSTAVAYLLWFFLGSLGIHKFYLNQNALGVVYLLSALIGFGTVWFFVGIFFLIPLAIALIIDIFLIPGRVALLNSRGY